MSRKNRRKKARNTAAVPEGTAVTTQPKKKKGPVHGLDRKTWVLYLVGFAALAWSYFILFTRNWSDVGFALPSWLRLSGPGPCIRTGKKARKRGNAYGYVPLQ